MSLEPLHKIVPPKFYKDNTGDMQGLEIEIMRAITEYNPKIRFLGEGNFMPIGRIFASLEYGQLDVFLGAGKNKSRLKFLNYISPPLYTVCHVLAVRKNDPVNVASFTGIEKLGKQGKIVTLLNTATHRFIARQKEKFNHYY
ncbi:substrate-binding periplasmic protein [Piscirickettsia litoralis]|uniref:Solute-binding protein family 3/N-terminal domain-containing protein n=1 Tax=Piscirickettsia litoralis TaxID=1891921 RepID=A0ABX2ZZX0_9GAMM|nr:transporter substrate-binding domain-containing protein [Piscirickettsia litoralis]ODN41778.1 hypothetical protein BGC07_00755 [Piscirickettsia litoralis]